MYEVVVILFASMLCCWRLLGARVTHSLSLSLLLQLIQCITIFWALHFDASLHIRNGLCVSTNAKALNICRKHHSIHDSCISNFKSINHVRVKYSFRASIPYPHTWIFVGIFIIAVGIVALLLFWCRRRRRQHDHRHCCTIHTFTNVYIFLFRFFSLYFIATVRANAVGLHENCNFLEVIRRVYYKTRKFK